MQNIIDALIRNSKSSQMACIEIHNKPMFPFRYEVCVILNINSWELLLKAFILKFYPKVKVLNEDGTTKPFDECLAFVASELSKEFIVIKENIQKLYEYRCNIIHFYIDDIDVLLFGLLSKNVLLYHKFLLEQFDVDIADEANLVLLPIGFKKPISPLDFLSNKSGIQSSSTAVQSFVKSIIESTETIENAGLDDSIFFSFKMALMNESRIKNADVVAAITKDKSNASINVENVIDKFILVTDESTEGVKHVKIDEESLFKTIYTLAYPEVFKKCKEYFIDFKQNKEFHDLLNKLKKNPNLYKKRYANVLKPTNYQGFYSEKIFEELGRHYKLK